MSKAKQIINQKEWLEVQVEQNRRKIICSHKPIKFLEQKLPGTKDDDSYGPIPKKKKTVLTRYQKKRQYKQLYKNLYSKTAAKSNPKKHSRAHKKWVLWKKAKLAIWEIEKGPTSSKENISDRK